MKSLKFQNGATLIEVAIAVLILSTSLLAMATLQTRSLQFNQGALMRSQANIYTYDIIDRIRINRGSASENITKYNADYDATPSGNTLATSDVSEWRANITRTLPGGKGKIECVLATRVCTISIKWSEEQLFGAQATSNPEATTEFVYSSGI
jgi:type IV pilus assembly protein PilV